MQCDDKYDCQQVPKPADDAEEQYDIVWGEDHIPPLPYVDADEEDSSDEPSAKEATVTADKDLSKDFDILNVEFDPEPAEEVVENEADPRNADKDDRVSPATPVSGDELLFQQAMLRPDLLPFLHRLALEAEDLFPDVKGIPGMVESLVHEHIAMILLDDHSNPDRGAKLALVERLWGEACQDRRTS